MLDFKLPEVGENIKSGNVVNILVAVGDAIKKDQSLLELETDKASLEVPSPCDGVVREILIQKGQDVAIGQVVMRIEEGAAAAKPAAQKEQKAPPVSTAPAAAKAATPAQPKPQLAVTAASTTPTGAGAVGVAAEVAAAPSVRRFAREIGVNIAQVPGTGPKGRISIEDVKAFAKQLLTGRGAAPAGAPTAPSLPNFSKWGAVERQAMNNVRKKTAAHMGLCWSTIPHVTQFDQADITELEKLRKKHSTKNRKLTVTPFILKVLAAALKEFPQFNASIDTATSEIVFKKYCHVGVAVDTDRGLLVPVIRDVDKKTILQLADELNTMAQRARDKKTSLDELQGGSMTITNLGGIGGTAFTPIVNWPEVAILGISRGKWEPMYENGHFIPRFILPLSLSYDHRLIDGADGARFLRWVADAIEHPFLMELK